VMQPSQSPAYYVHDVYVNITVELFSKVRNTHCYINHYGLCIYLFSYLYITEFVEILK